MKTNAIVLAVALTAFGGVAAATPQAEHATHAREHQV
jgi:hypothetical protein